MGRFPNFSSLLPLSFFGFRFSSASAPARKKSPRLDLLTLEERAVPAVLGPFYSVDGGGNNLAHADWGQTGTNMGPTWDQHGATVRRRSRTGQRIRRRAGG